MSNNDNRSRFKVWAGQAFDQEPFDYQRPGCPATGAKAPRWLLPFSIGVFVGAGVFFLMLLGRWIAQ